MHCKVIFNYLVPDDLHKTPYVIFTSHGKHTHPPPPPTKPPAELMMSVINLIQRQQTPTLSLCMY